MTTPILTALDHIRAKVNHLSALAHLDDLQEHDLTKATDEILYDLATIHHHTQERTNP
jgi:hypothetical protein